jgi:hypothetical protein
MPTFNKQDSSIVNIDLPNSNAVGVNTYNDYNYAVGAYSSGTTMETDINKFSV